MHDGDALVWERDGRDWPNREASRFVQSGDLRWHVQRMGDGPVLLLLHGTGASTHSWRGLAPLLAEKFTLVAPDLPGHGFTGMPRPDGVSLRGMADGVGALLETLDLKPEFVVGHSAGAAILARMILDNAIAPLAFVSLNGALLPFRGVARHLFSPLAKLLVLNPFLPRLFSWGAGGRASVQRLIRDTGSKLDDKGVELYERLLRSPAHIAGALRMMANWDLEALARDLPRLRTPLILVAGGEDRAISSDDAFRIRDRVPAARVEYLRGLGHLAHEEQPVQVADIIVRAMSKAA